MGESKALRGETEMMTPDHERWDEFYNRLEGPEGCDFQEEGGWKCGGGHDQTFSRAILTAMGFSEEDVVASLQFFTERGGHCDCEVLFNVKP